MATVSYRVENVVPEFIDIYSATRDRPSDEYQPAVVALTDGGFAVAYQWNALDFNDQSVFVDFYNADGSRRFGAEWSHPDVQTASSSITAVSAAQLSDGNVIVTWTDSDSPGIHYAKIDPSTGDVVVEDTKLGGTDADDSDGRVVALAGGGWALVKADYRPGDTDDDADLLIYNSAGVLQGSVNALDDNSSRDENEPAVAVLTAGRNKGAMAIAYAYEKTDGSNTFGLAVEIWNAAGQRVLSPFPFDLEGNANRRPAIVALKDGGFAVGYEDDEYGQSGYTVAFFDQGGNYRGKVRGDTGSAADAQIAMTVLANGYVYVTHSDTLAGSTPDIRSGLFDPVSMTRLMSLGVVEVQTGSQFASSVAVLKNGTIATAWTDWNKAIEDGNTDPDDDHVSIQIDQIVRTTRGDGAAETLIGDQLVDEMFGNFGGDTLRGGGGNDRLFGEGGSDTLDGGAGADTMDGGADSDTFIVDNAGDVVVEAAGGGIDDRVLASVDYVLKAGVEVEVLRTNASGGTAAIDLTGNALKQAITGNAGANILNDGGGAGVDTLRGLGGNDTYRIANSGAIIIEAAGGGTDTVTSSVDYVLKAGVEVEVLRTSSDAGAAAIDLTGNTLKQTIVGNAGANILSDGGGAGVDTLRGLGGNDIYRIGNSAAIIQEAVGGGSDTVEASVDYGLKAGVEVELLRTNTSGGTAAIDLTGNAFAQTIIGNAGANILSDGGGAGIDTLRGLGGDDTYRVGNSGAVIVEAVGGGSDRVLASVDYVLKAGVEVEMLRTNSDSGTAAIDLTGNALKQTIRGNAGSNILDGKGGNDTLAGFGGKDFFVFSTSLGTGNIDTVSDFNAADDTVRLQNAIFTKLTQTGALAAGLFRANSTGSAVDGNDFILYDTTDGRLYYDADGNGAGQRIHFATLTGAPAVSAADFVVI